MIAEKIGDFAGFLFDGDTHNLALKIKFQPGDERQNLIKMFRIDQHQEQ